MSSPIGDIFRRASAPRPLVRCLDWARDNVQTADGRPYDHAAYPHLGAPGGPMDALDCPQYTTIWLQWASRLGKTFFGQTALMKFGACDPGPMMFASADQKLSVEVTARTYRMLEKSPALRNQLRPPHRRKQDFIELQECRCFVAWARSVSTLADKAVRIGHANEIDKWEHQSTSTEADPLKLFSDRFKEFPTHKKILESTPAIKSTSRIERGRLGSTNCSFYVPCAGCGEYQLIRMDNLKWEKHPNGKSDRDTARRSARYVCPLCGFEHGDEHRAPSIRAGVWVPEGCGVDKDWAKECAADWKGGSRPLWRGWSDAPWITGTPLRDARDAGYQLSSLYALSLGWGDIAAEFVESQRNPQNLRNFVNQWLAETWETRGAATSWEELGKRIISDVPRCTIPLGFSILTVGCDIQADHVVYVVVAWGEGRKSHILDYGTCDTLDDLRERVLRRTFEREGGGAGMKFQLCLIDSGYHPRDVYQFCRECHAAKMTVWPCKGSNQSLNAPYRESRLGDDTLAPGAPIVHIDTLTTQDWLNHVLSLDPQQHDGAMSVCSGSLGDHQDFLEQLINEAAVAKLTPQNQTKEVWERIDENIPNDYRDCFRYSFAAMLRVTRGADIKGQGQTRPIRREERQQEKPRVQFLERPGGWLRR
jgi:phage terminase large subunit GpA-like protein